MRDCPLRLLAVELAHSRVGSTLPTYSCLEDCAIATYHIGSQLISQHKSEDSPVSPPHFLPHSLPPLPPTLLTLYIVI